MPEIVPERLARDQVDRHGVAGKGVHHQQVEVLRRLRFDYQARVSQLELHLRRSISQIREFRLRNRDHLAHVMRALRRIDEVKRVHRART